MDLAELFPKAFGTSAHGLPSSYTRNLRNQNRSTEILADVVLAVSLKHHIIGAWATLELIGSTTIG